MPMTDEQKKLLIFGGAAAAIAFIIFRVRKASAAELPGIPKAALEPQAVITPAAGGGLPTPGPKSGTFKDAAGNLLTGPSTPLVAPAESAADTLHTVQNGESWSNIAARAYGDYRWWPFLWDYNRTASTQFDSPDKLLRGASIKIPSLPSMADSSFQSAIFARALKHLDYWKCRGRRGSRCVLDAIVSIRTNLPPAAAAVAAAKGA